MSVENNVFLRPDALPAPAQWARAIREAGFELYTQAFDLSELSLHEREELQDRSLLVTLVTHADMREYMSSMIASAVLCAIADGRLAEGGEPPFIRAADALGWARGCEPGVADLF